ncbi:MAG: glycosyltransferase family 9 protein [Acidobacteria bacterium]|nr:glycosyltransferase family 9 protein [Acidobacteriota bacterium]
MSIAKLGSTAKLKTIAIIRLSSLGDIVHTLPAFQLLRRHYPEARISWIAEPAGAALLENFSGIDRILVFDLKARKGWVARIKYLISFVRRWRRQFDLVPDFQGLIKSALLSFLLGGSRLGFASRNAREWMAALFYSRRAAYFPEDRHVIFKNMHLLSLLGISSATVEYPVQEWLPSRQLSEFLEKNNLTDKGWTILNVGGGWPSKVLSEKQWLQIAAGLKNDYRLVMLWGNEKERETAAAVSRQSGVLLAPFMNFSDLIYFIDHAQLVISGDTLALHLADLTRTPAVGIFGPSSPQRNGPLFPGSRVVFRELSCSFCYRRKCDTMSCLRDIVTEDIIEAARKINAQHNRNSD